MKIQMLDIFYPQNKMIHKGLTEIIKPFETRVGNEAISTRLHILENNEEIGKIIDLRISGENRVFVKNGKTSMEYDIVTGDLLTINKPWYQSLSKSFKKIESIVKSALNNVDNPKIVEKHTVSLQLFSSDAVDNLNKIK